MEPINIDYRYSQNQLEALFRQARQEDVEQGGRFDTGSVALNLRTRPWNNPVMRDKSALMGTFYAAWAEENRLWKAEVQEGFSIKGVLQVLGALEERALGAKIHE